MMSVICPFGGNTDSSYKTFAAPKLKRWLITSAVIATLASGGPTLARAQDASTSAKKSAPLVTIEQVTVTATRREQKLGNVPVAVTALSALKLETAHITNFVDLPALIPGATWVSTKGPSTANIEIRGQSATNDAPALEVPVAIYMDDIYYGTLASFSSNFYDVDNIQILRGPQGTTFGRNVVGGAVLITTRKPELGVNNGEVSVSVNSFPGVEVNGFLNGALTDKLAGRLAFSVKQDKGYVHNLTTGHYDSDQNVFSLRGTLLYQPTSDLTFTLMAQASHEHDHAAGYVAVGQGAVVAATHAAASDPWDITNDVDGLNRRSTYAVQLRGDWTRSFGTLSSISSFRHLNSHYEDDGDSTPMPLNKPSLNASEESAFSEELRLNSPAGQRLEYVAGIYYSYEDLYKDVFLGLNGDIPASLLSVFLGGTIQHSGNYQDVQVTTLAPYAEATYHVTKDLALIAGLRYTIERKEGNTTHTAYTVFYGNPYSADWKHNWYSLNPRGIIQYTLRPGLMFYGSISTGFKGGGYSITSLTPAAAQTPLKPEQTTSYELGSKGSFFSNHVSVNVALYEADTDNVQVRSLVNGVLNDSNAAKMRVRGLELESSAWLTDDLEVGVNYAYTDAKFPSYPGCAKNVDCSGNIVPYVPRNDLTVFAEYDTSFYNGTLTFHVDDQNTSNQQVSVLNNQQLGVPYTGKDNFLNAWFMYEPDDADWKVQFWGKNLLNHYTISNLANYYFYFLSPTEYGNGLREVDRGPISPPRQFGVTLTYKF